MYRGLQGELVAQGAEAHDAAARDVGKIRMVAESLPRTRFSIMASVSLP
jgi:hypothetical protein